MRSNGHEAQRHPDRPALHVLPPPENSTDLRHFPAVVEAIGKRVKVKVFMECAEQGVMKHVSAKRLVVHSELQF